MHGGFFHSNESTWGCATHKSMPFRASCLAKGIIFSNLVCTRECFLAILVKESSNSGDPGVETQNLEDFGEEKPKI